MTGSDLTRRSRPRAEGSPNPAPDRKRSGEAGRDASSRRAHQYALALVPVLGAITHDVGRTATVIASELTRRGIRKPRGGGVWTPVEVRRLLHRLDHDVAGER